jgi:N-acetylneuraminic acid mutarotase
MDTVEAYDPATNTWTTKAPMPTARWELGSGVVDGILYAIGGLNDQYLSTVEAYDPAAGTWTTKASMPNPRFSFALGVAGKKLYIADGCCKGTRRREVRTLWAFSP